MPTPPGRFAIRPVLRARSAAWLLLVANVSACSSDGSSASGGKPEAGASRVEYPLDPCPLLGTPDFLLLTPSDQVQTAESHNVGSKSFSPECHYQLTGQATGGSDAASSLYIDPAADFDMQKSIFKGEAVSGLGKAAWKGDVGGLGNMTVGVLTDQWSFRVDGTYEYDYDDLTILASNVAARLK
ncbi:MAG TPA: hypothetical protein VF395_09735 [Polyangiaceae bacterium]